MREWFCRHRRSLLWASLGVAALAPLAAWGLSEALAVDPASVLVVVGGGLFAVWRPYRDSWLRPVCRVRAQHCTAS